MSGLAAVLAGRTPPGLYSWHAGFDVAEVRHTVEHAGWGFGHVDGLHAQTKPDLLRAFGEALDFPDWYGQNFDALADCLSDVGRSGVGTVLLWDGWATLARADEKAFDIALTVLGSRVHADRGVPFSVLLRGDGPPVPGITSLD